MRPGARFDPAHRWQRIPVPGYEGVFVFVDSAGHLMTDAEAPPRWTDIVHTDRQGQLRQPDSPHVFVESGSKWIESVLPLAGVVAIVLAPYIAAGLFGAGAAAAEGGAAVPGTAGAVATGGAAAGGAAVASAAADQAEAAAQATQTAALVEATAASVEATSTISSTIGSITSSIRDIVADVRSTVAPIVGEVQKIVSDISGTVRELNESLIRPIVQPIKAAMDAVEAIRAAFERAEKGGIRAILDIPESVSRALSSVDAAIVRSVQMLGATQASNAELLARLAFTGERGRTVGQSLEALSTALAPTAGIFTPPPVFDLAEPEAIEAYKAWVRIQQEELFNESTWAALLWSWAFKFGAGFSGFLIERQPYLDVWREEVARASAVRRFTPGEALALLSSGVIPEDEALEELSAAGFHESRARALIANLRKLPETSRALDWYSKGWIDNLAAEAMLRTENWHQEQIELLLLSSYRELSGGDVLDLVRRGLITEGEGAVALQRQGFRQADSALMLATRWRLVGLADLIALYDRASLQVPGAGFDTLRSRAPTGLHEAGAQLGIAAPDVDTLWANHWRLLSPELAAQAYFRGYIRRDQLAQALAAASLPEELHDNFIDLQRPQLAARQVITLMLQGIIDETQAVQALRARGYSEIDIAHLVRLERGQGRASQADAASTVEGLTKATVLELFDAGTLAEAEARELLGLLGWSAEAIDATLTLHQVKSAHAERMAGVDLVKARARAGLYTLEQAQAALVALELSEAELVKASAALITAVTEHTKMPGESVILDMWRLGVLPRQATVEALTLLGYSEAWAELLIELESRHGTKSAGPQ